MAGLCGVKMVEHNFSQKLEFSLGAREKFDIELLGRAINGCVSVKKTDIAADKRGIDYVATLNGGAEIGIDAKAREKGASKFWRYGEAELALEIWSVCPSERPGKVGWTLSDRSNVDMILYTFDKSDCDKFYLLPFQHLRMAFNRHGRSWCAKYLRKKQHSNGWTSEAVFVPASVVIAAIADEMIGIA